MSNRFLILIWIVGLGFMVACGVPEEDQSYVARVGSATLTYSDVQRSLANQTAFLDSTDAVSQVVERWITNELLYQEAVDRGLMSDPSVQRLLEDNARSVMVSAIVDRMTTDDLESGPDEDAIRTYYEQHRNQLALREPFARVRHLIFLDADSAESIRSQIADLDLDESGMEAYALLSAKHMPGVSDPDAFYPLNQLFSSIPQVLNTIQELNPGDILPVISHEDRYHVIQLVQKLESGDVPDMELIIDDLRKRVTIQMRKQLYERQVQRLRTRALARDDLEIR
ncbi:MAG: peptidylprolyl isomerase [Rhodothermales bacterium]|jgi:hypothetical protein|nr:peptidylprolyl isomerase [Rhodothermales bacterium]MDG2017574.1 peptidylprolyl isomerase [Rhodothermales bacterium]